MVMTAATPKLKDKKYRISYLGIPCKISKCFRTQQGNEWKKPYTYVLKKIRLARKSNRTRRSAHQEPMPTTAAKGEGEKWVFQTFVGFSTHELQVMQAEAAVLSSPCLWREASRIINEEGFRAFWKGNLVTVVHRLPYSAVNFYAYEEYKSFLQRYIGNTSGSPSVNFVSGGLARITAASATYPLDLVRTRLAARGNAIYYQGIGHAFCVHR